MNRVERFSLDYPFLLDSFSIALPSFWRLTLQRFHQPVGITCQSQKVGSPFGKTPLLDFFIICHRNGIRPLKTTNLSPHLRFSAERRDDIDDAHVGVEVFAGPLGAFVSGQVLRVDGAGQC
jgi:hypothetical protein